VHRPGRYFIRELRDGIRDPAPDGLAVECAFIDDRGGVGIRLNPAAAIVQYGEQFRTPSRKQARRSPKPPTLL
jgi:hypothetical protein